ncbi:MAG: RDD family protein [Propionibacteriaceae bacterium]|jgi:uncharacterized RDD family membrane protein YckC|nr:RDD family protein [Propionibacteriaceae bacterium]
MAGEQILTGEGVALMVQPASVVMRALAWLIDFLILTVGTLTALFVLFGTLSIWRYFDRLRLDEAMIGAIVTGFFVVLTVVIPTTVETLTRGRSLGKKICGLKIIRDDGGPIRLRHAFTRQMAGLFELWLCGGGLAFLVSMFNNRGKRVGDLMAGTYCASLRVPRRRPLRLVMPPRLGQWAVHADISPVPDALALSARQFLARVNTFPPQARAHLALRIAAQLEEKVAPSAPVGTQPEEFIVAVLVERGRRETLAVEAGRRRALAGTGVGSDAGSGLGSHAGAQTRTALPYSVPDPD